MARIRGLLAVVTALGLPLAAVAQVELGDQNRLLSIAGRVAADQKAAAQFGIHGVSVAFTGESPDKLVWIGVVRAETWNGDVFAGSEMLSLAAGHTPTMMASGKPALLAKIRQAPVGSRIIIEGIFDEGSRSYLVGMVEVTPAAGGK